jgi:phage terminase large subunit GpA-like protein
MAQTVDEIYRAAAAAGARPDPLLTVSEWADQYRALSQRASAEPGPWRTERTPYLREIMDCLSPSSPVERVVFMKGAQIGGPLALDTPIPTASGWTTMGEIRIGETVFDDNGQPCTVRSVSAVFTGRPCFRFVLSDGAEFVCDAEHRWVVWDDLGPGKRKLLKATTGEMYPRHKVRGIRNRYAIDVAGPLTLPAAELPIDPYLLGVWLGNGSAWMNQVTIHENDIEFPELLRDCGFDVEYRLPPWRKGKTANLLIDGGRGRGRDEMGRFVAVAEPESPSFMTCLRETHLLCDKRIPAAYLRASVAQRLALLQGLMDTDGHCTELGRCEFSTASPALRDGAYELIVSLGMKATIATSNRPSGKRQYPRPHYRISFLAYSDLPVFRLERKFERQKPLTDDCRPTETFRRRVVAIERVASVPVRCIEVDSPSHLYLVGRAMVPTHNTECGNNWIGYVIHQAPGPMMAVQPTVEMAKRNSKQRIDPLIEESEVLRKLVRDPRSRDSGNTVLAKEFTGGVLVMTGANSAVGLRSMAARYLFLDEVDGYPGDVDGEGDPVNLALARTRTFARRKVFVVSTPKITGLSRIEAAFAESDQRIYWVPCPRCREFQTLKFAQLTWPKGKPKEAVYVCEHCRARIENHEKHWMLAQGEWRPSAAGDGRTAGFHLSSIYSPVGWFSWADAAKMFEQAQKTPALLQVFVNTVLGETWAEAGEAPDWQRLYERRENYKLGIVPAGGLFLVAGCDVQRDRLEIALVAWGRHRENWLADYVILDGDTSRPEVWERLTNLLNTTYPHASGARLGIVRMAVDSGYATQQVYAWARRQGPGRVLVTKGYENGSAPIGQPSAVEVTLDGRKIKRGVKVWPVATGMLKSELYGWLKLERPTAEGEPYPPGYCHICQMPEELFKQLTAEQLVAKVVKGYRKLEWVKTRERNEALDTYVLCRAAAAQFGMDRFSERHWKALEDQIGVCIRQKADDLPAPVPVVPVPRPATARRVIRSRFLER